MHVADVGVAVGGKFEQHDGGDWRLGNADGLHFLLDAILENQEVGWLETGDELVSLIENDGNIEMTMGTSTRRE